MHEVALIDAVLKAVQRDAVGKKLQKITKVTLSVGKLTMALPAALTFAFQVLSKGTMFAGAELEIEQKELFLKCCGCGIEFFPAEIDFCCPVCSSNRTEILAGRELSILSYEGEGEVT